MYPCQAKHNFSHIKFSKRPKIQIDLSRYMPIFSLHLTILKSEGDCRIKNIELALTKSIPHVYFLKNKQTGLVHVLAIDNDKKFYDQSNGKYSEGDFFDYYEKEYLIIYIANIINKKVENSVFDSKKELTIERLGYAYYINLFLFFK